MPLTAWQHRKSRTDGSLCRVFARLRPAEIGENAVSQELRDMAIQPRNFSRHRVLVGAHDLMQLFRIETVG